MRPSLAALRRRLGRAGGWLRQLRRHRLVRLVGVCLMLTIAILAAAVVSTLAVDLGPSLRGLAEREASRRLERPVRLGALRLHLARGRVLLEDFEIAGVRPGDRPFFTADRLSVSIDWSNVIRRRPDITITSVELTDWEMLVEKWDGGHNFPRLTGNDDDEPDRPRPFTATLRYVRAWRGHFSYFDYQTPWSVVAPNIDITVTNEPTYHGQATFSGGTVSIQEFVPMWANMTAHFTIDGSRLVMDRVDLESDGARSVARGALDLSRWPEQKYAVESKVHFPRMRELFFANERWRLSGDGEFQGTFHLFKGGHDLSGSFLSEVAGVDAYRFPSLYGGLRWTNRLFEVTDAGSELYGGDATFGFSILPNGPGKRSTARFDAAYEGVDLAQLSDFYALAGQRFGGRATGWNSMTWPMGRFRDTEGEGQVRVEMPPGAEPMTASLAAVRAADADHALHAWGPFAPQPLPVHLPVAGEVTYRFDPEQIEIAPSRFATERTFVAFHGTTAWGAQSRFELEAVSRDWQESDQVLAGILTDFGSRTGVVAVGGRGEFAGVMTGPFRRPRIEGAFRGEDLWAWDTLWGDGTARVVIENSYVRVADASIARDGSEIRAEGLFSLGYPRRDGGDEIDARFRVSRRDLDSLRHAFEIDAYPVSGRLSGEFHLTGAYETPVGFGAMTIEEGEAYGEPFEKATASLRFDGSGVRLDSVNVAKGGGVLTGAAYVGWDSTYSFNVDARRVPVEQVAAFAYPALQPSGLLEFSAGGSGTFDEPRYDVRFRIHDVFVVDEGVGQMTGTLALRGTELTGNLDVASPRLAVTGSGRIGLSARAEAELALRFHDSSLDPYVRIFVPQLSPFTTAVATGTIRVAGELANLDRLLVDGTIETLDLRLFDYAVRNDGPVRLALDNNVVRVNQLALAGEDTRLTVTGTVGLQDEKIALRAEGDAHLGILQGFFRDVRGSGQAALEAAIDGPLWEPVFSGSATISDGRVRHFALPNALDAINGAIHFDSRSVRLDELTGALGGGRVQFGGRVDFDGYLPGELNVTARGEGMQLRYPEGVRSTVDADLTVRGNVKAPTVGGSVLVRSAVWNRRVDPTAGLFDFGGAGDAAAALTPATIPLRFDVELRMPSTLRIDNNLARLVASAELQLRGSYDRPLLFGRAEVDRGEVIFEGRRYLVTRGSIDFTNPTRIEPFFDVEAETRVRVPGQTYRVIVSAAGTTERLQPQLSSDPPLPAADVLALLFSDVRRGQDVELRALQDPNERQRDILTTRATQLLASPISSEVGRVVEQTFGVDTFQLTPSLIDPYSQSQTTRVNPSARVTIGKRISDRVYLTFSRSVSTSINDQILLLEYDESDRLSWILSRNEDQTYAIEVRVRHTF